MDINIDSHDKIRIYHIYFNMDLNYTKPLYRGLVFSDQIALKESTIIKIGLFKIAYMFIMQERKFKIYIMQKEWSI